MILSDESPTSPKPLLIYMMNFYSKWAQATFQAFFVACVMLYLLGHRSFQTPPPVIVRRGLMRVVPLAFGATLADEILAVIGASAARVASSDRSQIARAFHGGFS